jgi:hypothetical protein
MMRVIITGAHTPDLIWLAQHLPSLLPALLPELDIRWLDAPAFKTSLTAIDLKDTQVLLSGLDQIRPSSDQQHIDTQLRAELAQAKVPFGVVYGQGLQRLRNAQRLVQPHDLPQRAAWACDACSDPDCEFKLFTGLKGLKAANPPAP